MWSFLWPLFDLQMAIFSLCPCLAFFFFFLWEHLLVCSDLLFLQGRRLDYIPTLMSTFSLIKSPISKYCHPPRPWRLGLQHINSKRTQHSPYIKGGMHRTIPCPRWAACETDVSPCPNTHTLLSPFLSLDHHFSLPGP